jgi:histidinol dehydrogenase
MCCVPARVAGVEEMAVATPPGPDGRPHDAVLAACALCGVDEVYAMGGAQAVAALALGTETIAPVDVIVGPGSHYVQEAKRQVIGQVGIDGIAGPTELVVVGDEGIDPDQVALDLAAQAEHGSDSLVAFVSTSEDSLEAVRGSYDSIATSSETVSEAPLALVQVATLDAATALVNAIAPEHVELMCDGAEELADSITAGACIFIETGAAFGDYAAGSNHVLPTGGAARFSSPLGVATFRHRQTLVSLADKGARALAPHISALARAEGFPLHAESAEARSRPSAKRA